MFTYKKKKHKRHKLEKHLTLFKVRIGMTAAVLTHRLFFFCSSFFFFKCCVHPLNTIYIKWSQLNLFFFFLL